MTRYNGKCTPCARRFSVLAETNGQRVHVPGWGMADQYVTDGGALLTQYSNIDAVIVPCPGCGKSKIAQPVLGKFRADKKCDGRCLAATGHQCECACGGKNHGAGNSISLAL